MRSCHIKILEPANLERREDAAAAARLIAVITVTLKPGGHKCQQEHWLEDGLRRREGGSPACLCSAGLAAVFTLGRLLRGSVAPHQAISINAQEELPVHQDAFFQTP